MDEWAALGSIYSYFPHETIDYGLQKFDRDIFPADPLSKVAGESHEAAYELLCAWLKKYRPADLDLRKCSWLRSLPDMLKLNGDLDLSYCSALASLPQGLHVNGELNLYECASLTCLPKGLYVKGWTNLESCHSWDGEIPQDAVIGGPLFTDIHLEGISLTKWRNTHPKGERPQW